MHQSIHEGFTLDVLQNYTTYGRYFTVKQTNNGDMEIPVSQGKRELVKYVDSHEQTIQYKVNIILDHWIDQGSRAIQGRSRGMIVTQSRRHCIQYFEEINRQLKERGLTYKALVGFSGEVRYSGKNLDGDRHTENSLNRTIGHEGDVPLGLKNPAFRLLIVANKFQTGFDEPLVQTMYVDKHLGGVQCVQTLSRLNRRMSGKDSTFVLDFVNKPEEIKESFQRFYTSTILEGETDQNSIYDTKREVEDYNLYTEQDLDRFCEVFFDPKRDEGSLHPVLDRVVEQFKKIKDQDQKDEFKSKVQKYTRLYGYLSQIVKFEDIKLEKSFVFLKYLYKKLPRDVGSRLDISDDIDLDSLRIQETYKKIEGLIAEDSVVTPPGFEGGGTSEPELDLLSEIINQVNNTYGIEITEDDKVDLTRISNRLIDDPEIEKYMEGENSEEDKRDVFKERFESMLLEHVNDRFDFYKKIEDNQPMKNMILQTMYSNYTRNKEAVG